MIKNYLKVAWRNLWKNKSFSIINITGLAVGMCGAILIFTWIQNEMSFDQFHTNKANLYKIYNRNKSTDGKVYTWDITASPVGPELQRQYPEVKAYCRVYWPTDRLFNYREKSIIGTGLDVDKQFLTMFSFKMLNGSSQHALDDPTGIVLTTSLAKKIFGSEDALNKMVHVNDKSDYKVTGIIADPPANTQFEFDYLLSLAPNIGKFESDTWNNGSYNTYVQLKPGANPDVLEKKMKGIMAKHDPALTFDIFLHPAAKWHLYSRFENGKAVGGVIETVRLLLIIAIIILLIACINFMNLSTAQSEKRGKEVGVRKVIGANRFVIIKQFLSESILISVLAGILAMVLVQLLLPSFNNLTQETLHINYANPYLWLGLIVFVLITGLLAGSYPAFYLSSFRPVKVLKGVFKSKTQAITPRKLLVVAQFTVAIVLTIATIVIYKQVQYVQNRDNGYVSNNLVEHPMTGSIGKNFDLIKNDLINSGAAVAFCKTSLSVTVDGSSGTGTNWGNMDPSHKLVVFSNFATQGDFVKTFGFKLISGRDINFNEYPSDSSAVLVNEASAKVLGFKNPVGQTIEKNGQLLTIVGEIKNFIISSPYKPVDPMLVFGSKTWYYNTVTFKLNTNRSAAANLKIAGAIFKKYNPAYPFQYHFVDEEYNEKFANEQRTESIALTFAALTIFISCLGLFGLAAYMAENRRKEIGIRKVLGASIINVMQLLTREFVILVIVAIMIATPIGWWAMNKWLQDYDYRISISWQTFAIAGLAAIVIAVITVSYQAGKAAMLNLVKSIKTE